MKTTVTVHTVSPREHGPARDRIIERCAFGTLTTEITGERTRVVVIIGVDGSATVETFRAHDAATSDDPDRWTVDACVTVPVTPERPTHVEITPHTNLTATERLAF